MNSVRERSHQVVGHVQQMLLFHQLFKPGAMLMDVVRFPVDRYLRNGHASWPTTITLVIRSECNVRCVMCHSEDIIESREPFMSLDDLRTFIQHLGPRNKRPSMFLTGGEPFLRKDILDVIALIKEEGMACGIVTNGTLLPSERIDRLIELDLDCLVFSLHGSASVHDGITQRSGSYAKLITATQELIAKRRRRMRVIFNAAILESNVHDLNHVVDMGEQLGVDAVRYEHLNFMTPHQSHAQDHVWRRLDAPDASVNSYIHELTDQVDFLKAVESLHQRSSRIPVFFKPDLNVQERAEWYSNQCMQKRHCVYPWRSLYVTASGDAYPCQFMLYKVGNLVQQPLSTIWNGERLVKFRREVGTALFPGCARCCKL